MLTTWQQQSSYATLLLLFPSSLSFCCSFCSHCLPGYPHKITILSDCILRLCRAVPGVAFGSCRSAGQVEVAPSRLRLISICCRAKFMTVISKRRAANTFLMPHAETAEVCRVCCSPLQGFLSETPWISAKFWTATVATVRHFAACLPAQLAARSGNVYSPQTNFIVTWVTW